MRYITGQRVELSPATDLWMRGARYGTVAKDQKENSVVVKVKLDRLPRAILIREDLLNHLL